MASAKEYLQNVESAAGQLNGYTPSNDVQAANQRLAEVSAGKPAEYTNADADSMGKLYDQIMNRGSFSYDPGSDAVYQQAKQNYQQQGQQAMRDTVAQTNAMNGGYGSSWAMSAGAQQYGEYLKGINDILPQLEQNAYAQYNSETDRLNSLYSMAQQKEATAYSRYRDDVSDWQNERNYAQTAADNAYDRDYNAYSNRLNMASTVAGWNAEDNTQARSDAYSWALTLIQQGIMPTADVLTTAGISSKDAKRLAEKYGYGKSSGGSGGTKRKRSGSGSVSAAGSTDSNDMVISKI